VLRNTLAGSFRWFLCPGMTLYMDLHERQSRALGNNNTADVSLRDAVALIIGFLVMHHSDDLSMNKIHTHGILQAHVVLVPGSHVTLFVPDQKNDKLNQGLFVTLALGFWFGDVNHRVWIQRLLSIAVAFAGM